MSNAVMNKQKSPCECTLRFEKCIGGFKIHCCCNEQGQRCDFQNLCRSLCDGNANCYCTRDGLQFCKFDLCCAECDCDCKVTKDGCCITCTSCDANCSELLQSCCDCLEACCKIGCCCNLCFGDKCCCCGTCAA